MSSGYEGHLVFQVDQSLSYPPKVDGLRFQDFQSFSRGHQDLHSMLLFQSEGLYNLLFTVMQKLFLERTGENICKQCY